MGLELLLWLINIILFIKITRKYTLSEISITVLSYYSLFLFGCIGSLFSLVTTDWWLRDVKDSSIKIAFFIYNALFFLFSILLNIKKYSNKYSKIKKEAILQQIGIEKYIFPLLLVLIVICIFSFLYNGSALRELIHNPSVKPIILAELRGRMGVGNSENKLITYFNNIVIRYIVPYIFIYYYLVSREHNKYKIYFLLSFLVLLLSSSLTLAKAPIISSLLLIAILRIKTNCSKKSIAKIIITTIIATFLLYTMVMGSSANRIIGDITHRIVMAQYFGFPLAIEVFPKHSPFLGFSGISGTVSKILGINYQSFSRLIMHYANSAGVEKGISGYMSTVFYAEGYAYAGYYGLLMSYFISLEMLIILDKTFGNSENLLRMAFYYLLLIKMPMQVMDGFSSLILNAGLITVALLMIFIQAINIYSLQRKN